MAVFLSLFAGAGQQFFSNAGQPLAGGTLNTYAAGTSVPQATYTTSSGLIAHANPIVLDSSGRVPAGGEIWLTSGAIYKFVLKDSAGNLIQTLDNVGAGIDSASLTSSGGSALIGFIQSGSGTVATTVQSKLREAVSAFDYMTAAQIADVQGGAGLLDVTAAVQAAIDSGKPVFLPYGTYKLATPLKVQSGNVLLGQNGMGSGYAFETTGTYLKPTTCAIQTSDYTTQMVGFMMHNVGIVGGTVQIDLGLFHEVDIVNMWGYSPSVGGLVIVRGEKHRLERIRFDSVSGGNAIFGMSVGRWEESLYGGYSDAFFAPDGAFFDRASIKDVHMQAGNTSTFAYGLKTNILSGTTISNFVVHGINDARETSVVYTRTRWQQNQFLGCAPDSFGNAGTPAPIMFEFGQVKQSTFMNISPAFAGNNHYTKGISTALACFGASFLACNVGGDNATVYGFYFPNDPNQYATLLSCEGSYYHASVSQGIRDQISQVSCHFDYSNGQNTVTALVNNKDKYDLMMADTNGASAATSSWGVTFANGGGTYITPFAIQKDRMVLNGYNVLYASAAPVAGTWQRGDIVYNTTPSSAGYVGWVCTSGGTPGTWKTFGLIS